MKEIINNKQGSVFLWVVITFAVFGVGIIYMILTQPIILIQNATAENLDSNDYAQSYNTTILVWKYWPIVLLVGLIIIGIIGSLKKEPFTRYDQI